MYHLLLLVVCALVGSSVGFSSSGNGCPPGVPLVNCFVDPCQFATCPRWPFAECRSNYCGGCNADFYLFGFIKVNCGGCPPGVPQVRCFADPCQSATCPRWPSAKCQANYCGGCNADFYVGKRKVDCNGCPPGVSKAKCPVDPCQTATCPGWPLAECRSNCGRCSADFYMGKTKVDCKRCPNGSPVPDCLMNPCLYSRPAPGYKCVLDACCGCTAKFVKLDGSQRKECLNNSCATVRCGYGSTCQINYCNGCTAECTPPRKG